MFGKISFQFFCIKAATEHWHTVRFLGLIKTSAWLLSLIAPLGDPWVASTSTLRLKWMFTSPNDYLSQCWVNASVLSAAKVTHTLTETRARTSAPLNLKATHLQLVIVPLCSMDAAQCPSPEWRCLDFLFYFKLNIGLSESPKTIQELEGKYPSCLLCEHEC